MKKIYEVYGHASIVCSMRVHADSQEEAVKIAQNSFGSLQNYTGNGGTECLIGVSDSKDAKCIFPDGEVVFDDAQIV